MVCLTILPIAFIMTQSDKWVTIMFKNYLVIAICVISKNILNKTFTLNIMIKYYGFYIDRRMLNLNLRQWNVIYTKQQNIDVHSVSS